MNKWDTVLRTITVLANERDDAARCDCRDTLKVNKIIRANEVVVARLLERHRQKTLLLTVGLVDTSERLGNNGHTTKETRLQSSVLTRRALTVVVVTNHNPRVTVVTVVDSRARDRSPFTSVVVLNFVRLTISTVSGTNQTVV